MWSDGRATNEKESRARRSQVLKRIISIVLSIGSLVLSSSCGKENKKNNNSPRPMNVNINSCHPGQIYNTTHGCLNQNGCQNGHGWVPNNANQAGQCVPGTIVRSLGTNYLRWGKALSINNRGLFRRWMKEFGGFCDRPFHFSISIGFPNPYKCKSYDDAGYIILQTNSTTPSHVSINIGAGTDQPGGNFYYGYYYDLYYSMWFTGAYYNINSSGGFELRSQGLFGTRSWNARHGQAFRVRVERGRLNDDSFRLDLYYRGEKFASALVERY